MNLEDLYFWEFSREPSEGCKIECPECKVYSHHEKWTEYSVFCEDCGDHAALECPNCKERFDHVWGPTFEVINKE